MDINAAYREVGTYRGAAEICGTTHRTVKRVVTKADGDATSATPVAHNYDDVRSVVEEESPRPRAVSRRSVCCRSRSLPATTDRRATSVGSSPK